MGRMVFVGDKYIGTLMELIGVETHTIFSIIDAEKMVRKLVNEDDVDVLIVPEDLYVELGARNVKFKKEGTNRPVLVVIPPLTGAMGKRVEDLYNLVSQAVGVKLQLGR